MYQGYVYVCLHPVPNILDTKKNVSLFWVFCLFFFFNLCLNLAHESETEGHIVISQLVLGDGTWTDSLFSSFHQTYLPLAIPQLWFRRQAALAPSQFCIRLPCHYLVVALTRVLCVRLSGALLPGSQALQTGATHHRRPWSVDLLQLWQLGARIGLAGNIHFPLMCANTESFKRTFPPP